MPYKRKGSVERASSTKQAAEFDKSLVDELSVLRQPQDKPSARSTAADCDQPKNIF